MTFVPMGTQHRRANEDSTAAEAAVAAARRSGPDAVPPPRSEAMARIENKDAMEEAQASTPVTKGHPEAAAAMKTVMKMAAALRTTKLIP